MVQIKCLGNGLYSLKNSHIPFGQGFQPPPPYGQRPFEKGFSCAGASLRWNAYLLKGCQQLLSKESNGLKKIISILDGSNSSQTDGWRCCWCQLSAIISEGFSTSPQKDSHFCVNKFWKSLSIDNNYVHGRINGLEWCFRHTIVSLAIRR